MKSVPSFPRCCVASTLACLTAWSLPAGAETLNVLVFGTGGFGATVCAPPGSGRSLTSAEDIIQGFDTQSPSGGCSQQSSARIGGGSAGIASTVTASADGTPRVDLTAVHRGDFTLVAPADYAGGLIPVSLRGFVEGEIGASLDTDVPYARGALAQVVASIALAGYTSTSGSGQRTVRDDATFDAEVTNAAPEAAEAFAADLLTPTVMVDPLRPLTFELRLSTSLSGQVYGDSDFSATAAVLDSLSFARDGAVLVLPEGFDLDAPEYGVLRNAYVGVVPLPPAMLFLLGGLGLLGGIGGLPARRDR